MTRLRTTELAIDEAQVLPIRNFEVEMRLVREQVQKLLLHSGVPIEPDLDVLEILVTTFRELRSGRSSDGQSMERLSSVMSTAEAVAVGHAVGARGYFLRGEAGTRQFSLEFTSQ